MPAARRASTHHGTTAYNPLTAISWAAAVWADDPNWSNPGNGNAVASWRTVGTLVSTDLAQATAGSRPTFSSSVAAINNKGAVDFSAGTRDVGANLSSATSSAFSVVVVGASDNTSGYCDLAYLKTTNASPWPVLGIPGSTYFGLFAAAGSESSVAADTSPHFFMGYFNGASSAVTVGATVTSPLSNLGTTAADALWLNSNADPTTNNAGGYRAFVGIYDGDITADGAWATFKTWVNTYYGVTT